MIVDHCIKYSGTSTELRRDHKCGYLLRIEREDGTVGDVLSLAQKYVEDAALLEEGADTIAMSVNENSPGFLAELATREGELEVLSYSFSVEQLEDMLMKTVVR